MLRMLVVNSDISLLFFTDQVDLIIMAYLQQQIIKDQKLVCFLLYIFVTNEEDRRDSL